MLESYQQQNLLAEQADIIRLDAIIDAIAVAVVIYHSSGMVARMNAAADRLFDSDASLPLETPAGRSFPPDELPAARALRGETVRHVLAVCPRADTPIWLSISAAPLYATDGTLLGAVLTCTDVTLIYEFQRERDTFIHTVSHDLRAPMTIISGYAELLQDALQQMGCENLQRHTQTIHRGIQRMNVMIQDLVDLARLEGRQMQLVPHRISLAAYVDELLQRAGGVLHIVRMHTDFPPDLPPVAADYDRLERICLNLLSNAQKYSAPDTPIVIRAFVREEMVIVSVIDQGCGITAADLPRLFQRFYRARGERIAEGIGLGLYITRMLVEAHGGRIWVESVPDVGSTFSFTLPVFTE